MTAMFNPDLRRKIKVRMRPDLQVTQQIYNGQLYYIVKDPVSLRYYRFREEEMFLLQQFDGFRTLDDVRHEFIERFRPQQISVADLEKFVTQLLQAGIAVADTPQIGARLYEKMQKRQRDKLKGMLLNIMYLKLPLFDPDWLLEKMMPVTGWMFTIPAFLMFLVLWLSSALLVLVNWQTFMEKLPTYQEFFTFKTLIYFWVTLTLVKVIHEFGHGLSCKRFGGEVHEMGVLFMVMTPCLYCNVSDAWMLPSKWHKAVIGAAGMYVELIMAAIFTWVWWFTEPGLINTLSLSIIVVCSVTTVLFNGNPLLRFDGYYILADLMEIPNLRERANKYLGNRASLLFFGSEVMEDPFQPRRHKWFFITYAIAAYIYRWVVTIGILWFLYTFLKPYKLEIISQILALAAVFSMFVFPLYKTIKQLSSRWRQMKVKPMRVVASMTSAVIVLAAVLLCPFPMRIDAPMIIQPREAGTVYVTGSGLLERLTVKDGDRALGGMVIGRLYDPKLLLEESKYRVQFDQAHHQELAHRAAGEEGQARQASIKREATSRVLREIREQQDRLEIRLPPAVSGVIMGPPKQTDLGKTYKLGEPFCKIGDPALLEAYIVVQHSDINFIAEGGTVWLKVAGHVGEILEGQINRVATRQIDQLPPAMSNKVGGEVQTRTESSSEREEPMFRSYALIVPIPNGDQRFIAGTRGTARIDVGYRSLAWRITRYLQQTFHFSM